MSTAIEVMGLLLCLGGLLITGASLANDSWKVNSNYDTVLTSSQQYENLWRTCLSDSRGIINCKTFESLLALPAYIQACRALMIVSLLIGVMGIIAALMGQKCTKIGSANNQTKGKIALMGGICFIFAGLSSLAAVSWYANQIIQEFYNPFNGGTKFELGVGLYIGWGGAFLSILGGALLCCSCRNSGTAPKRTYNYDYSAAGSTNQQKIYKAPPSESSKAYV
ncbi:claudin-10 isoform X2 [Amia ocellicauda]|uniref:claudin-10 isoform X2 n=1 Tax=Amia ocellicauda TaxID=2972642 RepID=UPI003463B641